jgi:dienelactone hydrolase
MKYGRRLSILLSFFPFITFLAAAEPLPESTPWDIEALMKAPSFAWTSREGGVQSLTYRGLPYQGKATRVFAYTATPSRFGVEGKRFPALVLVHGGGGAAFSKWVELWAKRGYVAIAMDLAGKGAGRKPLPDGGPDQGHQQKFSSIDEPLENQWSYHAVANVLLAHSLLRSFEGVDLERIGVTGISWGGYLTCIVAGLDPRFSFAMPVYGCGFLQDNSCWKGSEFAKMSPAQLEKWRTLWDPSSYLASARMPLVFVNGSNDFAYPVDSYAKTCALVRGEKNYSIQLAMPHGHLFDFPEFFHFADQYLKGGTPLPVISRPVLKGGKVTATVKSPTPMLRARLHYTTGPHARNQQRKWMTRELLIEGKRLSGEGPPDTASAWYLDLRDDRDILVSSQVMIR